MSKPLDVSNLKFGDKLRTRDGRMAIFLMAAWDGSLTIAVKDIENTCYIDKYFIHNDILEPIDIAPIGNNCDIIEYWEE